MIKVGNIGWIELGDVSDVVVVPSRTSSPSSTTIRLFVYEADDLDQVAIRFFLPKELKREYRG
jgi:hypothetical protein